MAYLTVYTRQQFRETMVEEYETNATVPVATDAGSGIGSFFDGASLVDVVQQRQNIYVANISRLNTIPPNADGSPNPDVDTFCSPFIGPRGGQQYAKGPVTFYTSSAVSTQVVIPVGVTVQAGISGLLYTVIADPTNTAYNAELNGYPINVGGSSVNVTVLCQTAGIVGNAQEGQINLLYAGPGAVPAPSAVSSVSNASAFTTGSPYETDAEYKARFTARMMTGQGGTLSAMSAAILGVNPGITFAIADRQNASGATVNSYFTVVCALLGQTGSTSATLIGSVTTALEGNPAAGVLPSRPAGISYQVIGPTIQTVNVSATVAVAPGYVSATVQANIQTAVSEYIASLGLPGLAASAGTTLAYLKVAAIIYGVAGVQQVDSLVLQIGSTNYTTDITITFANMFASGTLTFTIT